MSVKLELYRVFKEVAEVGNITAAAQALYISQSAVSQSIKQLERDLQTRLFARNSRGVTLTAEGQMLYEYVRSAMGLLETGEEKLSQTRELQMGQLTIGASDTVTSQFLLPYLDTFVAGAEYPCDFRHVYTLEEIAAFPLILLERKASSRLYLERFFLQNGLKLNPEIELGARSLLVDLAAIGFGVAGVTEEFVRKELDSGRLKKLKTSFEIPARSVDMCLLSDVPQSAAAERFTDFVKDSLSKL